MKKWTKIDDAKVRHIWKCSECGEIAVVEPSFYGEAGTPICTGSEGGNKCEGEDMVYVGTEILK